MRRLRTIYTTLILVVLANAATAQNSTIDTNSADATVTLGNSTTSGFHIFNATPPHSELLRVQADGRVGIGTANPGQLLTVSGGDVSIKPSANNVESSMGTLGFGPSVAGGLYTAVKNAYMEGYTQGTGWYSGTQLRFLTHPGPDTTSGPPTVRMIIDKDGNVGINTAATGTAAIGSKLSVSVGNVDGITVASTNSGFLEVGKSGADRWRWANDYNFANHLELLVGTSGANPGTRIVDITSSGNVGIGATPTTRFQIGSVSPVQFLDMSTLGQPNGYQLKLNDNSQIEVAGLELGDSALPVVQSTDDTVALYLNRTKGGSVQIGTSSHLANLSVSGTVYANYQDVAEWVPAAESMPAGTVVVLSDEINNTVKPSTRSYDTGVAGVVSPKPGLLLGVEGPSKAKIATTGRVRVRVDATKAPIRLGDLLVTSDRQGVAMKSQPLDVAGVKIHRPGTLIGKALEPLPEGEGEILVLLSLQ